MGSTCVRDAASRPDLEVVEGEGAVVPFRHLGAVEEHVGGVHQAREDFGTVAVVRMKSTRAGLAEIRVEVLGGIHVEDGHLANREDE